MNTRNIMRRLWAAIGVIAVILSIQVPVRLLAQLQGNEITQDSALLILAALWLLICLGYLFGFMYLPWYTLSLFGLPYSKDDSVFTLFVRILFLWAFTVPYMIYYETMTLFGGTPADEPSPGRVSIDNL